MSSTSLLDHPGATPRGDRIALNSLLTLAGFAIPTLVGVITTPRIISGLGPERFAVLSLIWLVLGYLGAFDFGLGRATTKFVAEALHRSEGSVIPRLVSTTLTIQLPIGIAIALLVAAVTPVVTVRLLHLSGSLAADTEYSLYLLAVALPISQVTTLARGILEAFQRFGLVNLIRLPASIGMFLLPLIGVWLHMSLPGIVWMLLTARCLTLLAHVVCCFYLVPGLAGGLQTDRTSFRTLLHFGGWSTVSVLIQQTLAYIERFLVGFFLSVSYVAYYSVPADTISRLAIIPLSLSTALFPELSVERRNDLGPVVGRALKYLSLLLVPLTAAAILVADDMLAWWLGSHFARAAAGCAQILLVSFLLNAIGYIPFSVVQGQGKPDWKAKLDLLELPVFVGLCSWLIPAHGLFGAALAKLTVQILDLTALFWMMWKLKSEYLSDLFLGSGRPTVLLCGGLSVVVLAVVLIPQNLGMRLLIFVASLAVFCGLAARYALDERDLTLMRNLYRTLQRSVSSNRSDLIAHEPGAAS